MEEFNISFEEALLKAQSMGFAESNPISDINGDDVSSKLKILSSLCFNTHINSNIYVEGIKQIDNTDINNANKLGYRIKLLGVAELFKGKIIQRVHPSLIKKNLDNGDYLMIKGSNSTGLNRLISNFKQSRSNVI